MHISGRLVAARTGKVAMSAELIQNPSILPWEKQIGETDKAFAAFVLFRDEAADRTYQKVADSLQCSHANVRQWAYRWKWRDRVDAFDRDVDEKHREAMARGRTEMRERQARIGASMQIIGTHGLRELQAKIEQKLPLNLSTGEIAQLISEGAKMERAARGEDAEGRYTQINVNLGETADEDAAVPALTPDVADGEPLQ
jgi:hypothetical protein